MCYRMLTALALGLVAITVAASAQDLRPVDWSDPLLEAYVAEGSLGSLSAFDDTLEFSLPVLGFDPVGGLSDDRPLGTQLFDAVSTWPDCALGEPGVDIVPSRAEEAADLVPGTWFSLSYDFGCVEIVVEGDRNAPDPAVEGGLAPAERGRIEIAYEDENAAVTTRNAVTDSSRTLARSSPVIAYHRAGLVYAILISCAPEASGFCADEVGLRQMVDLIVPIAGEP